MAAINNYDELFQILKERFGSNLNRHQDLKWEDIQDKLSKNPKKCESLLQMENSGGEPDAVGVDPKSGEYLFYDCAAESPKGRRSFCYDKAALDKRKENKPKNNAVDGAESMGIEILNEEEYRELQKLGTFDTKTSSWLKTPEKIRKLGGALFGDFRYDTIFIYHNGAESYYAARGFRGVLRV
ncbi:DUF4256 domain-containing protein [Chryseobacterium salivictor]|uniref:DUF4256 domain-containing protein n=1 Tax=Chryseobacterium salivictor TaxID=2547600 RepID=A0A4P6ZGK5_9FLAO|nr:DUF4256 domain-containing protein [Chryseobacterium salivictor]QBO58840.1 hypothetical protein NBC122_02032 [Chryseobacterium salivictor]